MRVKGKISLVNQTQYWMCIESPTGGSYSHEQDHSPQCIDYTSSAGDGSGLVREGPLHIPLNDFTLN